ncbi:MAG TPA: hypothetical protein VK496_06195 [Gaiellaceae bacterium]|nr:hypothetical protein [Gaiellaceae bacterium]
MTIQPRELAWEGDVIDLRGDYELRDDPPGEAAPSSSAGMEERRSSYAAQA